MPTSPRFLAEGLSLHSTKGSMPQGAAGHNETLKLDAFLLINVFKFAYAKLTCENSQIEDVNILAFHLPTQHLILWQVEALVVLYLIIYLHPDLSTALHVYWAGTVSYKMVVARWFLSHQSDASVAIQWAGTNCVFASRCVKGRSFSFLFDPFRAFPTFSHLSFT